MKKNSIRNSPFFFFQLFTCFIPIIPIAVHFFSSQKIPLYIIPTFFVSIRVGRILSCPFFGYFSDKFGRKKIITMSPIIKILVLFIFLSTSSIPLIILGTFLWGMGEGSVQGILESHIYDELLYHQKEDSFNKILSSTMTGGYIGSVSAAFIGSIIYKYFNYKGIHIFGIISMIISMIILIYFIPDNFSKYKTMKLNKNKKKISFKKINIKEASLILIFSTMSAAYLIYDKIAKFSMQDLHFSVQSVGMITGFYYLGCALSSFLGKFIKCKQSLYHSVLFFITTIGLIAISSHYLYGTISISCIILFLILNPIPTILIEKVLQDNLESNNRATTRSICTFIKNATEMFLLILCSRISKFYTLSNAIIAISLFFYLC